MKEKYSLARILECSLVKNKDHQYYLCIGFVNLLDLNYMVNKFLEITKKYDGSSLTFLNYNYVKSNGCSYFKKPIKRRYKTSDVFKLIEISEYYLFRFMVHIYIPLEHVGGLMKEISDVMAVEEYYTPFTVVKNSTIKLCSFSLVGGSISYKTIVDIEKKKEKEEN